MTNEYSVSKREKRKRRALAEVRWTKGARVAIARCVYSTAHMEKLLVLRADMYDLDVITVNDVRKAVADVREAL